MQMALGHRAPLKRGWDGWEQDIAGKLLGMAGDVQESSQCLQKSHVQIFSYIHYLINHCFYIV